MDVKICDFGLAAQLLGHDEKRKTTCGTPNYLAPEVFDKTNGYSYSVDIWAVGIIFYTMFFGRPPFEASDVKVHFFAITISRKSTEKSKLRILPSPPTFLSPLP